MSALLMAPRKPLYGAPCNGCGRCCEEQLCDMALQILDDANNETVTGPPCPFLKYHDGRSWCGVIEEADRQNVAFGGYMKWRLGIGTFCQMEDDQP